MCFNIKLIRVERIFIRNLDHIYHQVKYLIFQKQVFIIMFLLKNSFFETCSNFLRELKPLARTQIMAYISISIMCPHVYQ